MKRIFFFLLSLWMAVGLQAMTKDSICSRVHEVRIGWGDMQYETAIFHPTHYTGDYRYTGHIFATYQYRFKPWLSAGLDFDYEQVMWQKSPESGENRTPYTECSEDLKTKANFYNISLMPEVRFTYYWSKYVNLYSEVGIGLLINGGSERNFRGQKTAFAPVVELSFLGVQVGDDHWFGTVEFGGLYSLSSPTDVYMIASRIFSVSVGYRF